MAFPKPPEITDHIGCLDDASIAVDGSASAHVQREVVRNANAFAARGAEMFRWMASVHTNGDAAQKAGAFAFGWPFWHKFIPIPSEGWPVPKKPGITRMRAALRMMSSSGGRFDLQIGSIARPFQVNPPAADILTLTASSSSVSERFTKSDFVVQREPDEVLDFYMRGHVLPKPDGTGDALMVVATYGGKNTGTVTSHSPGVFYDRTTVWNTTGSQVHTGGHYVVFTATGDGRTLWGPCPIVEVARDPVNAANDGTGLVYTPPWPGTIPAISGGTTYTIYKMIDYRPLSLVCVGVDRTA